MREDKNVGPSINPFGLYVDPEKFSEYSEIRVWGRKHTKSGIGPWVPIYQYEIGEKLPKDSGFIDLYISLEAGTFGIHKED